MRFLKRLLCLIYAYLALFFMACLILWVVRGEEPSALIGGICGAAGIESIVSACLKWREIGTRGEEKNTERKL